MSVIGKAVEEGNTNIDHWTHPPHTHWVSPQVARVATEDGVMSARAHLACGLRVGDTLTRRYAIGQYVIDKRDGMHPPNM